MSLLPHCRPFAPLLALALASAAPAQGPAQLVGDLTTSGEPPVLSALKLTALGNRIYFWAGAEGRSVRDLSGHELWTSDGTAAGTRLLFDVLPGRKSSTDYGVVGPVALGDSIYFGACDDLPRCRLWKSDGVEGAEVVVELEPDATFGSAYFESRAFRLVAGQERLYFSFPDRREGDSLRTSDGTGAGTRLLAASLSKWITFPDALPTGDRLTAVVGGKLWTSDGTPQGTVELADLDTTLDVPRLVSSGALTCLKVWDGKAYRLWVSDGTADGTHPLLRKSLEVDELLAADDGRCFVLSPSMGHSLWITDGTAGGTRVVSTERTESTAAVRVGDDLYFAGRGGDALARVDVTGGGYVQLFRGGLPIDRLVASGDVLYLVTRSKGSAADVVRRWPLGGPPSSLETIDNGLHRLVELAGVDGALLASYVTLALLEADAHALEVFRPSSPASSWPRNLTATGEGDDLLFATWMDYYLTGDGQVYLVRDGVPRLLREDRVPWRYATTNFARAAGRTFVLHPDLQAFDEVNGTLTPVLLNESQSFFPLPDSAAELDGSLYFVQDDSSENQGIWQVDGTEVTQVHPIDLGLVISEAPYPLECHTGATAGSTYFFFSRGRLWTVHDGRLETILDNYDPFFPPCVETAPRGGDLFFVRKLYQEPDIMTWLYRSDGTPEGTSAVWELDRVPRWLYWHAESEPTWLGDRLFFAATDAGHGRELWSSDGTAEGTALFADLRPGKLSSSPRHLTVMDGRLYFAADDGVAGHELWTSDGTPEGTVLVADVAPGPESSYPQALAAIDGRLLFSAMGSREQGLELWTSDGTAEGTYLLQDVQPGPLSSDPSGFVAAGGTVYFEAATEQEGFELWSMPRDVLHQDPPPPGPPCPECLLDGRFEVRVEWRNPRNGSTGVGRPIPFSDESVLFWFFSDGNVELIVKVLDGRRINGHYWVFYGGLSDVEYWITVTDSETGAVREYHNPPGQICGASDTTAFD